MMSLVPQVLSAGAADKRGSPALFVLPRCPLPCADTAMKWSWEIHPVQIYPSKQPDWLGREAFQGVTSIPQIKVLVEPLC